MVTPRASNGHPLIINNKNNNKNNSRGFSSGINFQLNQIYKCVPCDIKKDDKKAVLVKDLIKTGIGVIGYIGTRDVVRKVSAGSHIDYAASLEIGINEIVQ